MGKLEIICGPMFSGKSEELIRRIRRAEFAKLPIQVFKHQFDQRTTINHIHAHSGGAITAIPVIQAEDIEKHLHPATQVIGIDEVQFFEPDITPYIARLIEKGKRIIAAGLDVDFRIQPFGCMPTLLAIADEITKLSAVCLICGSDARLTQRLVNGLPAQKNDPLVLIGAQECYQARCRSCHEIAG